MLTIDLGKCNVHETCKELEYYFIGGKHSWAGATVKIDSIQFRLEVDLNAYGYDVRSGKLKGLFISTSNRVKARITSSLGVVERVMTTDKFRESVERNNYSCGWHDGPNTFELTKYGEALALGGLVTR